eukprot:Lithocolla_globosa_v1_NODE_6349_length_1100_cov_51.766507.p3 type:complete len:115 gc:universal NODE_6349_length_1100_cov_51.766507:244-588(+)
MVVMPRSHASWTSMSSISCLSTTLTVMSTATHEATTCGARTVAPIPANLTALALTSTATTPTSGTLEVVPPTLVRTPTTVAQLYRRLRLRTCWPMHKEETLQLWSTYMLTETCG